MRLPCPNCKNISCSLLNKEVFSRRYFKYDCRDKTNIHTAQFLLKFSWRTDFVHGRGSCIFWSCNFFVNIFSTKNWFRKVWLFDALCTLRFLLFEHSCSVFTQLYLRDSLKSGSFERRGKKINTPLQTYRDATKQFQQPEVFLQQRLHLRQSIPFS